MTNNLQEHSILGRHGKTNFHLQWILGSDKIIIFIRHPNCYKLSPLSLAKNFERLAIMECVAPSYNIIGIEQVKNGGLYIGYI